MRSVVVRCAVGLGLLAGAAGVLHTWFYSDLVRHPVRTVADVPPYGDELRSIDVYADSPSCDDPNAGVNGYRGPGWYPRRSPAGDHVAVTTSWGGFVSYTVLGLVLDRPFYHTVGVWDAGGTHLKPVISIREADPGSGIAHRYLWSKDSRALLITGSGRLPDESEDAGELCLVYLPATDELYRLSRCPPYWQRSVQTRQPCWEASRRTTR